MKIKNLLLLIGPPGSGKGTQGKMLAPLLGYNYLSMGQTLREITELDTPLARQIKKIIDVGHIIPNYMIRDIFHQTVQALPPAQGLILDGFPRDIGQVDILNEFIEKHDVDNIKAVFIDVPKIKVIGRIKERAQLEDRADDDPEIIHTRFLEYDEKTHPLIDYFEQHHWLTRVDGDQTIEQVHKAILNKLGHG
jgi:adenylate kinase